MRAKPHLLPLALAFAGFLVASASTLGQAVSETISKDDDFVACVRSRVSPLSEQMIADDCSAGSLSCGATRSGSFSTSDCVWYGVVAGRAVVGYADPYGFSSAAGSTISVTFNSPDIPAADLLLMITTPPDSSGDITGLAHRWGAGVLTYTFASTGLYNIVIINNGGVSGSYTLGVTCGATGGGSLNLTPYRPSGWSDKIVVSTTTGTRTDATSISPGDTLYIDYAIANMGPASTQARFTNELYLDGVLKRSAGVDPPFDPNYYASASDYAIGPLQAGQHTLRLKADSANAISETDETDNEYSKIFTVGSAGGGTGLCEPANSNLCLNASRFRVSVAWRVPSQGTSGVGVAVPLSSDTGYFWFFDRANTELVVKVLDGRGVNGHYWVFYGALSDVEYTITVTDTANGTVKTYINPSGRMASVADTAAF